MSLILTNEKMNEYGIIKELWSECEGKIIQHHININRNDKVKLTTDSVIQSVLKNKRTLGRQTAQLYQKTYKMLRKIAK